MVEEARPQLEVCVLVNTLCSFMFYRFCSHQINPVGDGEEQGYDPDQQADDMSKFVVSAREQLHRMYEGQVAIQTDANQQKDPTVKVYLKEREKFK